MSEEKNSAAMTALEHILSLPKTCKPITNLTPANIDGSRDDDTYLYGDAAPPLAMPVSSGEEIPDFGEPKKFL